MFIYLSHFFKVIDVSIFLTRVQHKLSLIFVFLFVFVFVPFTAQSKILYKSSAATGSTVEEISAPQFLFHWTRDQSLESMSSNTDFNTRWSFWKILSPSDVFTNQLQADRGHGYLYTWHHPVTGMIGGQQEDYGDKLIAFELDLKRIRAVKISVSENNYGQMVDKDEVKRHVDFSKIDLIFHENNQEWIITNPDIIKKFTGDPEVLRPILEEQLRLLENPGFIYDKKDMHWNWDEKLTANWSFYR